MAKPNDITLRTWWTDFALEYLHNGNNARAAYLAVRPKVTVGCADVEAGRLLRNPKFLEFFKKLQAKLADELHYSKFEWMSKLVNAAKFDPVMLFEADEEGYPRLKDDWKQTADRHHALRSIKITRTKRTLTRKNGETEEENKSAMTFDAHSSMDANEKLGRVLGYDKTEQPAKFKIEDMNLFLLQMIDGFNKLPEKKVRQIESADDVEDLLAAQVVRG